MLTQQLSLLLVLGCLLLPAAVFSQVVEESEEESTKAAVPKPLQGEQPSELAGVARLIINRTNAFRQAEGLQEVDGNAELRKTARYFANYMARTDEYGHQADGSRPAERAKRRGYDYCIVSENIAAVYNSAEFTTKELAQQFFQGWRHSPGHRKNMLNPDVVETGVAVARSEQTDYYYAVQMFGRPKSKMVKFQITNTSDAVLRYEIADRTFALPPRYSRTHGRCRPAELTVHWPNEQGDTTVQPNNRDRYMAVREGSGRFNLREE